MEKDQPQLSSGINDFPIRNQLAVYTDDLTEYNSRDRWIYCQYCKFRVFTKIQGAKCGSCESYMITQL